MAFSYGIRITLPDPTSGQLSWDGPLNDLFDAVRDVLASRVTPAGINITADLDMQGNALVNASELSFAPGPDTGAADTIFVAGSGQVGLVAGEWYLRDNSNRLIQLTSSGVINVSGTAGFGGDYASASQAAGSSIATYNAGTGTYSLTTNGSTLAIISVASVVATATVDAPQFRAAQYTQLSGALSTTALTGTMTLNGVMTGSAVQDAKWSVSGRWVNRQVFTATGPYTPSKDVQSIHIKMVAGGGGGGGAGTGTSAQGAAGGGGASGAHIEDFRLVVPISGNVYIGAAGSAGASTPADGGTGGDTVMKITGSNGEYVYTTKGGPGGRLATPFASPSFGHGGSVVAGTGLTIGGGAATAHIISGPREGATGMNWFGISGIGTSGAGGSSVMGAGGEGVQLITSGSSPGKAAQGPGGGGGGGCCIAAGSAAAGGVGFAGLVIIDEYR